MYCFSLHLHIVVTDIVTEGTGCLLNLLNTPTVLFKVSTDKKAAFLPVRHNPRSEGHGTLPEGAAPLLLAQASYSTGSGSRLGRG